MPTILTIAWLKMRITNSYVRFHFFKILLINRGIKIAVH